MWRGPESTKLALRACKSCKGPTDCKERRDSTKTRQGRRSRRFTRSTPIQETDIKFSARNVLKGTVKSLTPGAVNTEIVIELPGGALVTSIITKDSAVALGLVVGKSAYAVIKASDVLVGVD